MNRSPPPPMPTPVQPPPTNSQPQQQQPPPDNEPPNKITPELLVDALSGHEDGLLSIAEKLMLSYDSGYDAMGEAIIDAFADVQKLFQHVVEAAHMEGAALERERSEGEWRTRLEGMGLEMEDVLYGRMGGLVSMGGLGLLVQEDDEFGGLDGALSPIKGDTGGSGYNSSPHQPSHDDNINHHGSSLNTPTTKQSAAEEHRHEELIDQDVRDVLIDAIRRGQTHREAHRFDDCRTLYELACTNASSLLPVDSDHRGRLQLAIARAESMASDRAVAILKYAMDDVLRSGLSLRRGKYIQMNVEERGDCVLSRPNPLRSTASRGYDVPLSAPWGNSTSSHQHPLNSSTMGGGDVTSSTVEQSAEEALNSLVEEMKEMLAAPIYNLTPLQSLAEKFWLALHEAKKSSSKKEERLEQSLAKIKADFLLAREEYEEQLTSEKERADALKRRLHEMKLDNSSSRGHDEDGEGGGGEGLSVPYTPKRPPSSTSRSSGGGSGTGNSTNLLYHFVEGNNNSINNKHSSSQSVVSLGSEFAQKARGLVHLLNCQAGGNERNNNNRDNVLKFRTRSEEEEETERLSYDQRRMRGGSPRL
ncbi:hypothetical protein ACHAXH_005175 [Discostella pseudostelligera]